MNSLNHWSVPWWIHLLNEFIYNETIIYEFIYSYISYSINSFVKWIHLLGNDYKWIHLLVHELTSFLSYFYLPGVDMEFSSYNMT